MVCSKLSRRDKGKGEVMPGIFFLSRILDILALAVEHIIHKRDSDMIQLG